MGNFGARGHEPRGVIFNWSPFREFGGGRKGDSTKTPMVRGNLLMFRLGGSQISTNWDDFFVSFHGIHIFFLGSELMENVWGKLSGISLE